MKYLILTATITTFLASMAFANEQKFQATGNFAMTDSNSTIDCDRIAQVLPEISSPDLKITITQDCRIQKQHNKFLQVLVRVLGDIGTWGLNEIACTEPGGGLGCSGPGTEYKVLAATLQVSDNNNGVLEGTPVVMNQDECLTDAQVISKLTLSSKNAVLAASCENGTLHTGLTLLK